MTAKLSVVAPTEPVDLDRLARMRPDELQRLHQRLFAWAVPSGNSELARRRIAWQIQAEREGGLPESARQQALAIAKEASVRIHVRRGGTGPLRHATVT